MRQRQTREQVWGERIRSARTAGCLTQRQLADIIGVSYAAIDRWERGVNGPSDALKVALAAWARQDPDDMFSLKAGS